MRRRAFLAAASLLVSWSATGPAVAGGSPPCAAIAFSPSYRLDRTAFCYSFSPAAQAGVRFWASTDGMRTWQQKGATGLDQRYGVTPGQLLVSPKFGEDRAVYLQTSMGLYRSTDLGASFALASAVVTSFGPDNLALYAGAAVPGLGGQATIVYADPASTDLALRIQSGLHQPIAGSPDHDLRFLLPPAFAPGGESFVVAERRLPSGAFETRLYACDAAFACATEVWKFPGGHVVHEAQFAPDFAMSRRLYVVTSDSGIGGVGAHLWSSSDGGRSFTEVPLTLALGRQVHAVGGRAVGIGVAFVSPNRVLLRWSYAPGTESGNSGNSATAPPANQVHRSDDGGRTWRRTGFSRADSQAGARGTLPWTVGAAYGSSARNRLHVVDGIVVTLGGDLGTGRAGIYCSGDAGTTWRTRC